LSRTIEEASVKNEQCDVEGGVSELLMSWSNPHTLPLPCSLLVHCTPEFAVAYNSILVICCVFSFLRCSLASGLSWVHVGHPHSIINYYN
jgi:hypothetical protein